MKLKQPVATTGGVDKKKICPQCHLPELAEDPAQNALSHDGKTMICSTCGLIESLDKFAPDRAYGLRVGQRRTQAALYGLDEMGNPKLPKETTQ